MFDVGFSELLIIAVIALLVLGPERLPKAARFAGLWVRKARAQWYSVKSELELELAQEEMKKHLQDAENSIKAPMQELQSELQQAENQANETLAGLARESVAEPPPMHETPAIETQAEAATPEPPAPDEPAPLADDAAAEKPRQGALW